jgi:hypothetical protein
MSLIRIVSVISIKRVRIVTIWARFMTAHCALCCWTRFEAATSKTVYPIHKPPQCLKKKREVKERHPTGCPSNTVGSQQLSIFDRELIAILLETPPKEVL